MGCKESAPFINRKTCISNVKTSQNQISNCDLSNNVKKTHQNEVRIELPLNERDVIAIMRSWKGVQVKMMETGLLVFLRMFEQSPEAKAIFEKFRSNATPSAMYQHKDILEKHGLVVMSAIDEVISNLDDLETVYELLIEQGRSHIRFTGLTEEIFWAIENPFMLAVKDILGDHFSMNIERIYKLTIRFILENMVGNFYAAKDENNDKTTINS